MEQADDTYLIEKIKDVQKMIGNDKEILPCVFSTEYIYAVYAAWDDFWDMQRKDNDGDKRQRRYGGSVQ